MNVTPRSLCLLLAVLVFLVAAAWARNSAATPAPQSALMAASVGGALLSLAFILPG